MRDNRINFKEIVEWYCLNNNNEASELSNIVLQCNEKNEKELIDRKNFVGHFTASAFVIAKSTNTIIMVHHNALKKYLQPGGHIEESDLNPLEAAKRELYEETGISSSMIEYRAIEPLNMQIPFNISVHIIPENSRKNEKAHYHYDLQYLFFVDDEMDVIIDKNESSEFEWVNWNNFKNMEGYKNIAKKIEKVHSHLQERFLSDIVEDAKKFNGISCIAVQHIIPSSVPFIKTLKKIFGTNLLICAKPNSIDSSVWNELESYGIKLKIASRNEKFDRNYCGIKNKTIIIDIGGYFTKIAQEKDLSILFIVEDTENGIKKYEEVLQNIKYPVFSVARNPMKKNEDFLVGEDIVFGAEYILHKKNKLIQYMNVACIGYGKIGYGICSKLRELGVKPKVIEKNSVRAVQAVRDGCEILLKKNFSGIGLIFCATGEKSLGILDFRSLDDGTFIVAATSGDDEFNYHYLENEYEMVLESEFYTEYKNDHNYFYILNQGTPTNFVVNSALGDYILLVHAAILSIMEKNVQINREIPLHCINLLEDKKNQDIALKWLKYFTGK